MNPPYSSLASNSDKRRVALLLILVAFSALPYFVRLGASSLWDSNEAFYAETPREMLESGDLLNPSFNYQPRFNKPPLSYWAVALFYKLFGVSETSERLVPAVCAILMMATAYWLARIAFSRVAGLLAAAGLAVSPRILMFSRRIAIDVLLSMFMGLALLFFVLAETRPERRRVYLSLMYVSLGLGIMTKGPVALLLPGLAFAVYLLITRQLAKIRRLMIPTGALIIILLVLPWYLAIYEQHGWKYIQTFLFEDNLSRFAEHAFGPSRGFTFYLGVLLGDMFPWSVVLVPALWFSFCGIKMSELALDSTGAAATQRIRILCVIWIAVIVLFFTLSRSKEDLYIMPAYPAAAALCGGLLSAFLANSISRLVDLFTRVLLVAGGLVLLVGGAIGIYVFSYRTSPYVLAGAAIIAWSAVTGGVVVMISAVTARRQLAVWGLIVALLLSNWVFVVRTLADFERYKPVRALCREVEQRADADSLIGYYRYASPSMVFYLRRQVFEYYKPDELRETFATGKQIFCVMSESDYAQIQHLLPGTHVLASRPLFRVKLGSILDRVEPPQVLLISNRLE
jgi:4-amino-4-deoxy-L-arabinose transferase-like glycosyltransferase